MFLPTLKEALRSLNREDLYVRDECMKTRLNCPDCLTKNYVTETILTGLRRSLRQRQVTTQLVSKSKIWVHTPSLIQRELHNCNCRDVKKNKNRV